MSKNPPPKPAPPPKLPVSIPPEVAEDAEAKAEFMRTLRVLDNKLDARDRSLMCDYCMTHSEIVELRRAIQVEGRVLTGPKGGSYLNPTVNLLISRQGHLAQLRRDLYFTPKSRIEKQLKATMSKAAGIRASLKQNDEERDED